MPAYPPVGSGAVIVAAAGSMAGDGPLVASVGAGLGLRTGLVANPVGTDTAGRRVLDQLAIAGIRHEIPAVAERRTPQLTVIAGDDGTRTWFASLHHAADDLLQVDLHLLTQARCVYIDCYRAIITAARRTIRAAGQVPLLLNLGGDPLTDDIAAASAGGDILAVQTNLDEAKATAAPGLANELYLRLRTDTAIVTVGRLGAVARTSTGTHHIAAPAAVVGHTHGAGAAFSAGYVHAILTGAAPTQAVEAGCRIGTATALARRLASRTACPPSSSLPETEDPMVEALFADVTAVDWHNLAAVAATTDKLLTALDEDRATLATLTDRALNDPHLLALCEHYDILDKIVLHDDPSGWRLCLHVFLPGYFDRPHNHRWTYASRILSGSYTHTLYGTDEHLGDTINPADLTPRMIRTEEPGDTYTLHHSMIHSVEAEPYTVSLIVRGPAVKDRFVVTDRHTGKAWWQYGAANEDPADAARKRMNPQQASACVQRLHQHGVLR
ncbi:carbohydrate kinase family protein [Virgisporangium aliadipatigenens]|uniref:carbohydrate kinase family protein n=1 Tax=Virgisporangium aliadipatigenens TaxID=741659 RepID=UPI0019414978|nr:carbohydrate kinase family protein [Virgisporangium aliadipatigenens]